MAIHSNHVSPAPLAGTDAPFRLLVDSISDYGIIMLSCDGRISSWNLGAERLFGYACGEILGQPVACLSPPEAIAGSQPQLTLKNAARDQLYREDAWRVHKDGSLFFAHLATNAIYSATAELVGFALTVQDASESRRQSVLPPLKNLSGSGVYKMLVDGVGDCAIFMLDKHGIVQTWNRGAEKIKGYTACEIIGRHFSCLFPREEIERGSPQRALSIARRSGRSQDEGWRVRQNGTFFWASLALNALYDEAGEVFGYAAVTQDMTDRRRAEEGARRGEERLRLLLDGVRDYAIFLLDSEGRVESWNQGAFRIKGYESFDIIGQHFSRFYPPEAIEAGAPENALHAAALQGRFQETGWRVRRDGSRFWADVAITCLRDDHGAIRGYAKVTRDISDRHDELVELRRAYEQLDALAWERTTALANEICARKLVEEELQREQARRQGMLGAFTLPQRANGTAP